MASLLGFFVLEGLFFLTVESSKNLGCFGRFHQALWVLLGKLIGEVAGILKALGDGLEAAGGLLRAVSDAAGNFQEDKVEGERELTRMDSESAQESEDVEVRVDAREHMEASPPPYYYVSVIPWAIHFSH
jgi:hypothetical protein